MGSRPIMPEFQPVTISIMLNFIGPNIGVSVCVGTCKQGVMLCSHQVKASTKPEHGNVTYSHVKHNIYSQETSLSLSISVNKVYTVVMKGWL